MPRHVKILIGIAVGATAGLLVSWLIPDDPRVAGFIKWVTDPIGRIFLRMLLMLVVPLLFSALVVGISELELSKLGRLGGRTLGYTIVVSSIAVGIGLALVNTVKPGAGAPAQLRERAAAEAAKASEAQLKKLKPPPTQGLDPLVNIVPPNVVAALAADDMLGWLFFSLLFAIALAVVRTPGTERLRESIAGLYDISMKLIDWVMALAPIAVGALLFNATATMGFGILSALGSYVLVVVVGLAIHTFIVYPVLVAWLGRRNPLAFFKDVRLAMLTAFSTASSGATLPVALEVAEKNLKLPRHVSRFVLTAGSTMNQNGTALFEGVTVIFLAQVYAVPLTFSQQLMIMAICLVAGVGTAGVPGGSLPYIAMIMAMNGIPPSGLALILGVDRFLDMCRTTVNVTGDLAAAVYVARGEPQVLASKA